MAQKLVTVAIGLIVVGAAILAGPTFGFSTIASDRGVSIGTADTSNALLAIEETGNTPTNQNDAVVVVIHNKATIDFDELATDVTLDTNRLAVTENGDFDGSLGHGNTTGLEFTCNRGGSGEATVTVDAEASGTGLHIANVTFEHTFQYSCTGGGSNPGGFQSVYAGNVEGPTPTTQEFSFTMDGELPRDGTVTIDITALGATYDSAEVTEVDGANPNDEAEFIERNGGSAIVEFSPHNRIQGGEEVTIIVENVNIDYNLFGWATFTESATDSTSTTVFGIDAGGSTELMAQTATADETETVTESDIELMLEEFDEFDSREEIVMFVKDTDGIKLAESIEG